VNDRPSVTPCTATFHSKHSFFIAIYVDELTGSDAGTGSETSPLKTVSEALERHGESIKVFVKKDADGYKDVSSAALKKAKKYILEQQRKLKKQEEQKDKHDAGMKKKTEEEAKTLEHAKSIVLTQDESLPKAEKVSGMRW
jgi:asparaginyl-tRNA synthetase